MLFSVLCSINYTIEFIDKYFVDEIPQKFKFAYLQYYYLCDFVNQINTVNEDEFYINSILKTVRFGIVLHTMVWGNIYQKKNWIQMIS